MTKYDFLKKIIKKQRYYLFGVLGGVMLVGIVYAGSIGIGQYVADADIFGIIGTNNEKEPSIGDASFVQVKNSVERQDKIKKFIVSNWRNIAERATNSDTWTGHQVRWVQDDSVKMVVTNDHSTAEILFKYEVLENGEVGFQIIQED